MILLDASKDITHFLPTVSSRRLPQGGNKTHPLMGESSVAQIHPLPHQT